MTYYTYLICEFIEWEFNQIKAKFIYKKSTYVTYICKGSLNLHKTVEILNLSKRQQ